jgi:copper chaperone CopZ
MRTFASTIAFVLAASAVIAQAPPPLPEGPYTYRVLGLFSKDREADLRAAFELLPEFKLSKVDFDHAEITVAFAPAKLFPGQKAERVTELVNDRLRQASNHTFGVKAKSTTARDKLQRVEIPAGGLDCKACCLAAYEIVAGIDGVEQATASFKEGKVTALIDPARTDRAKLEETLRKRGVPAGPPK